MKFIKNLQFIFRPSFWCFTTPYNKEWDEILNKAMDENPIVLEKHRRYDRIPYWVSFGTKRVWTSNYPYAFGRPEDKKGGTIEVRPSRLTILRLKKIVDQEVAKEFKKTLESL